MNRRRFLNLSAATAAAAVPVRPPRWNILFMLMDDMGWHDIGPDGNRFIDTPNLDRFAKQSARFTNAYAACPVCSPTRASIMTGKYPARLHLTDWIPGRKQWPYAKLITPQFEQQLPLTEQTLPKLFHPLGYRSAAIGKWHLGGTRTHRSGLRCQHRRRRSWPSVHLLRPGIDAKSHARTGRIAYRAALF
jgi:arylsulfatase A-like enzyme